MQRRLDIDEAHTVLDIFRFAVIFISTWPWFNMTWTIETVIENFITYISTPPPFHTEVNDNEFLKGGALENSKTFETF